MAAEPQYQKIHDNLLKEIQGGAYQEGERLPTEKELAESYGVSRITTKKAYEMLYAEGYVFRCPGKGTFVSADALSVSAKAGTEYSEETKASSHARGKPLIGIIMDSMSASFGMDVLNGMVYECHRIGLLPIVNFTYGSMDNERQIIRDMISAGVSGLSIICVQDKAYNEEVLKLYVQHFPVVLVDREMPGIALPVVTTDNYKAARDLTDMLLDAGHTKIGYISHSHLETSTIANRFRGFCDVLRERGVATDPSAIIQDMDAYIPKDDDEEANIKAYKKELSDYIDQHMDLTAFFAVEFYIAKLLFLVLHEKGLIGQKQIVYFDGFPEFPSPLSFMPHVLQSQYEIGVQAMRHLKRRIQGEDIPSASEYVPYSIVGSLPST